MAIMRPLFISLLLLITAVLGQDEGVTFVSPGPSIADEDYSLNTVHRIRSNFHIAWQGTNSSRAVSVVLFQYNGTDLVYPFEYVQQSMINRLSYDWTVVTNKDLSYSQLFLFNIFYDGETSPVGVSQTFNITDGSETTSTTTSSTSTSLTSSATSAAATTTSGTAATSAAAAPTETTDPESGGLSTGAQAGIGVGVAVVALGAIAAGFFLYRRRAKKQPPGAGPELAPGGGPVPMEQKLPGSVAHHPHEIDGLYHPHEMEGLHRPHEMDSLHNNSLRHEMDSVPSNSMRYELDGGAGRR